MKMNISAIPGFAAGVVVLALAASVDGQAVGRGGGAEPRNPCQIAIGSTPEVKPGAGVAFSARDILDLNFRIGFPVEAPEALELKLFTPKGHLYQSIAVPVAAADSPETTRRVAGYPHPVKVARSRVVETRGTARVAVDAPPFPVGGTVIVSNSLYGKWRVEAWFDTKRAACQASFRIES